MPRCKITRSKRDVGDRMRHFSLAVVIAASCIVFGNAYAQPGGTSGRKCSNLIETRVEPINLYACRASGAAENARSGYNRTIGKVGEEEFPKTSICQTELIDTASKAYRETLSCLERTKQVRAVELFENYYAAWLMNVRGLTKLTSTARQYDSRQDQLEESIEEKKLKLALALR